jgi:hypothetical protein
MIQYNDKPKCYTTHTRQDFGLDIALYGGSCLHPIIHDADVYIGLEKGMHVAQISAPWNNGCGSHLFYIKNMEVPTDDQAFIKMLEWVSLQLISKKVVHIGCIGGHGRTGLVLAGLKYLMTDDKESIPYLRKHYCKKAVESDMQMNYLHKLFGLSKVQSIYSDANIQAAYQSQAKAKNSKVAALDMPSAGVKLGKDITQAITIEHVPILGSIW